jgi:hypothetical protein
VSQQFTGLGHDERRGKGRAKSGGRIPRPPLGSWEDRSIDGFCFRHGWSRGTYENNRRRGKAPKEMRTIAGGKVTITAASEIEFDEKYSQPFAATAHAGLNPQGSSG